MLSFSLAFAVKALFLSLLAFRREDGESAGLAFFLGLMFVLMGWFAS